MASKWRHLKISVVHAAEEWPCGRSKEDAVNTKILIPCFKY